MVFEEYHFPGVSLVPALPGAPTINVYTFDRLNKLALFNNR